MSKPKILFVIGSMNQTTQMHKIANELPECEHYFSQLYGDHFLIQWGIRNKLLEGTILGNKWKKITDEYLAAHNLKNDYRARQYNNKYDLVLMCSDLIMPKVARETKSIWIQEGMIDRATWGTYLVKALGLPRYLAFGTSLNGASNLCDIYCTASEGYRHRIAKWGTDLEKTIATGIPNFDNAAEFLNNNFPYKNYVLVCTSDIRETFDFENRPKFIRKCVKIAAGRPLIFKLHPNEKYERAKREIEKYAPAGTLIFQEGNTGEMIANCDVLITQWSSVAYIGLALGKEVHSFFNIEELKKLMPIQNGGKSAKIIANLCRQYLQYERNPQKFLKNLDRKSLEE
ncbi:MAG: hypothetical protein RML72_01570 [Bacteroidia bacterium]|nr:hypothetical protein [Bacteroidia bacterium]MDW8157548.1 hypothetical protein [Bacteroidia bacterium]